MAKPVFPIVFGAWLDTIAIKNHTPVRIHLHPFHFQKLMGEIPPQRREQKGDDTYIGSFIGTICVVPDAECSMDVMVVEGLPKTPVQMTLPLEWVGAA